MLYSALLMSTLLFVTTVLGAFKAANPRRVYLIPWLGVLLATCMILAQTFLTAFFAYSILLGIFGLFCAAIGVRPRSYAVGSGLILVLVYASISAYSWRQIQVARGKYIPESVDARLAYEDHYYEANNIATPVRLDYTRPNGAGQRQVMGPRAQALRDIHLQAWRMFVEAPGFGVARTIGRDLGSIEFVSYDERTPDSEPLSIPEMSADNSHKPVSEADRALNDSFAQPVDSLTDFHRVSQSDFLDGDEYAPNRSYVIGFVPHRFSKFPRFTAHRYATWRIDSIDLISMLKNKEPRAYVSRHLPRMDELRDAPTRPLDDFEREHLDKVRAGQLLSGAMGPRRMRMIGALRAQEHCRSCHTANEGDLLGAFSYDLRLDLP